MKTITMYRPSAVQSTLNDFDRYVESFFGDSVLSPASKVFSRMPAVDIRETEKAYLLDMELPGYNEKDIGIHVDGSSLSITAKQEDAAEKKEEDKDSAEGRGTWLLRERRVNSVSRSFKLPQNANPEEVSAVFKNGVLSMEVKKRAEAQKRTIQINAA
ncbi:MAG: Hsp20/alpha crystallin family protein [Treponema sp.]|jgi:HSP20 family protein|nr:Hsp20/alpha crystallin family protein [Treponema sp.]